MAQTPADLANALDELLRTLMAKNLRAHRALRGWDQTELAKRCGVSRTVIAKVETQSRKTSVGELVMFATAFESRSLYDFLAPATAQLEPDTAEPYVALLKLLSHGSESPLEKWMRDAIMKA